MKRSVSFIICLLIMYVSSYSQTNSSGITLIKKTIIGGEGGWDYVSISSEDRHLYLSHGNQVEVLNADTHEKIGVIPNTRGVHGIAAIPALGKGYITNGKTNNVTVFNTKTLQPIMILPAGENPDALLYDKFSGHVFIFNNDSKNITVIDSKSDKIIKTIGVGGNPEAGVSNGKGVIYVNLEDTNEIVAFDSKTFKIISRFTLSAGEQPTGLAFDNKTQRLFSACRKSQLMMVLDAANGKVIAQLPIGKGADGAVFDDNSKLAICSNGDGTMTVVKEVSPEKFIVIDTIKTITGARTMAIDNKTQHLFTVSAQYGKTPAPTAENPKPWPSILPNTFMLLEYGKK